MAVTSLAMQGDSVTLQKTCLPSNIIFLLIQIYVITITIIIIIIIITINKSLSARIRKRGPGDIFILWYLLILYLFHLAICQTD